MQAKWATLRGKQSSGNALHYYLRVSFVHQQYHSTVAQYFPEWCPLNEATEGKHELSNGRWLRAVAVKGNLRSAHRLTSQGDRYDLVALGSLFPGDME